MGRKLKYKFAFNDGESFVYDLNFDDNLNYVPQDRESSAAKSWTDLEYHKCSNCPLKKENSPNCPVAVSLDQIVQDTKDKISYEKADITVVSPERIYFKVVSVQEGLLSLFGVIMASSGCPHMDWFKPLVRFHLPFSHIDETMFKIIGRELITEFFKKTGTGEESSLAGIAEKYKEVETVNRDFLERIRSFCKGDADKNAIVALNIFAQSFQYEYDSNFESLKETLLLNSFKSVLDFFFCNFYIFN